MRYSLGSLFWLVAAIAAPLGLTTAWGGDMALLLCVGVALVMLVVTRRKVFGIALLAYIAALVFASVFVIHDVCVHGPYVQQFNLRLQKLATDANMVGSDVKRVEAILGPATDKWNYGSSTDMDTGEPTPDATYWTTYNYAPYPSFPFAKFQVHCNSGKIQSVELYDD